MNKEYFLIELREKLFGLPQEDIEERIAFYNEMINDRMEDGLTEEEAIGEIGSVDLVVEQIMAETPFSTLVKERVKPKRKLKTWELVLLILGAPIWVPLVLAVLAVLLSIYIVIWSVVICIYAVDLSFAAGALSGLLGIVVYLKTSNLAGALFSFGTGVACAGLAILLFLTCVWFTKSIIKATGRLFLNIKFSLVGKEVNS